MNKPAYALDGDSFVIDNYDKAATFSSFLPGIAGVQGIPLWVYYCSRGQGVHSLGVHHKGNAIMEFNPANTAYENVALKGFRTFLRISGAFYEPFSPLSDSARRMVIDRNLLRIEDINHTLGVKTTVTYFVLPEEPIGALARRVSVENLGEQAISLEALDGLPRVLPYGLQLDAYKAVSNLMKSWADVRGMADNYALYSMRSTTDDTAEVGEITGGYYYLGLQNGQRAQVIYDPDVIFGQETSMQIPSVFVEKGLHGVLNQDQVFYNKYACGFSPYIAELAPSQSLRVDSLLGFAGSDALLRDMLPVFAQADYFELKEHAARQLVDSFTQDVWTQSGNPLFDQYIQSSYLDNFLRGGYPHIIGEGNARKILHLFNRKHGDPERDYNFFTTAGTFYSQGNGNFRDVCQNRRHDVTLNPKVGDFNVWSFLSLIQMDGYNPMEIRPTSFIIPADQQAAAEDLLTTHLQTVDEGLRALLGAPFTPGQLCSYILDHRLAIKGSLKALVHGLLALSAQRVEAGFGEGYWSDHFDYCLDLIEDYLSIYPDQEEDLFFGRADYRFYDSPAFIRPRADTQVITPKGIRHYGALAHDHDKEKAPGFIPNGTNWLEDAQGKTVTTTLFGKLLALVTNKVALLDPSGLGIEMDGGKPGWCDAMNGLPGLMGSGMPETIELQRILRKLLAVCPDTGSLALNEELVALMLALSEITEEDSFQAWQQRADAREAFRARIRPHVSGIMTEISYAQIKSVLQGFEKQVTEGIARALQIGEGIMPTYFTHEATQWEEQKQADGSPRISPYGLPAAKVQAVRLQPVPFFLEGPARMLRAATHADVSVLRDMAERVKQSGIYDAKLKMYKTSESLEGISMETGRIRAFTAGWLERESVFLHMEYKYFLGLLKAGLYEQFFEAFQDALIPFLNPAIYGRSILENSSFIASSVNPDPKTHGRGYVARLSGSTIEVISMWLTMLMGQRLFYMQDDTLCLTFSPILPDWLFDAQGELAFRFLSTCTVHYVNPSRKATFGHGAGSVHRLDIVWQDGRQDTVAGNTLSGVLAQALREGKLHFITAHIA